MNVETALDILITAGLGNGQADVDKVKNRFGALSDEEWKKIWDASELHQIWAVVWAGIKAYGLQETVPEFFRQRFIKAEQAVAYQYYHMLSFTTYVTELLREAGIRFYLLKGIALNALYPKEDMRKLSDADIYIPDMEECRKADRLLREKGFEPDEKDDKYHYEYVKLLGEVMCRLEVHWRPCNILPDAGTDRKVLELYGSLLYQPEYTDIAGISIPVLPVAENALELLLHMLQHYVHGGFGMKLICDWVVFWQSVKEKKDQDRFMDYLRLTGLTGFAWTVTRVAMEHMGLSQEYVPWMKSISGEMYGESAELMYQDIIQSGEFARGRKAKISIQESGSSNLGFYVKEVHRMMLKRFPKMKKVIIFWPVLWLITIAVFFYNNHRMNRGNTLDVIRNQKKRHSLLKQMDTMNVEGSKK